jgi:hypothetical protein
MFRKVENFEQGCWQTLTGSELMRNSDLLDPPAGAEIALRGLQVLEP